MDNLFSGIVRSFFLFSFLLLGLSTGCLHENLIRQVQLVCHMRLTCSICNVLEFVFFLAGHHSSKEVIDAYRNTCARLKIKPCEKLIKQLEVIVFHCCTIL